MYFLKIALCRGIEPWSLEWQSTHHYTHHYTYRLEICRDSSDSLHILKTMIRRVIENAKIKANFRSRLNVFNRQSSRYYHIWICAKSQITNK